MKKYVSSIIVSVISAKFSKNPIAKNFDISLWEKILP